MRGDKMEDCIPRCKATKLLVLGLILLAVRLYTSFDMWIVIGALLVIKGILLYIMPVCACTKKSNVPISSRKVRTKKR